ncbi:hypothetical protein R1flu_027804 [Riccia fluitans]|uniref:Uncharacterized protein n=1 Tax=Riccia fluitans TaxID=41844 RepID=A0ABD1XJX9_9MARC
MAVTRVGECHVGFPALGRAFPRYVHFGMFPVDDHADGIVPRVVYPSCWLLAQRRYPGHVVLCLVPLLYNDFYPVPPSVRLPARLPLVRFFVPSWELFTTFIRHAGWWFAFATYAGL